PLFLIIVLGILVYAIYFGVVHSVQQLAAEAARASVAGISPAERTTLAQNHVQRAVSSYPLIDGSFLKVGAAASASDANLFEVDLTYDASKLTIFVLDGLLPLPPKQIRRQAVVRRGGY
ncbi:MAG: TadE/TadG family type IV pilus assembly protein, partial [Hyphomicrobium sp.]|nr:TadE/TadG family type IV pilus assembly protein [Hyphomicrobium sp.]